jgi:hypothetical protein
VDLERMDLLLDLDLTHALMALHERQIVAPDPAGPMRSSHLSCTNTGIFQRISSTCRITAPLFG